MGLRPWTSLSALALMVGCHLIGGADDIMFVDGTGAQGGGIGAQGGGAAGGAGGAGGGVGGMACSCPACMECDAQDMCVAVAIGAVCETDGVCDEAQVCLHPTVTWTRVYGNLENDEATAITLLTGGDIAIGGEVGPITMALDIGGLPLINNGAGDGGVDAFAARLSPDGMTASWARTFQDEPDNQSITGIHGVAGDGVVISGHFETSIDIEGVGAVNTSPPSNTDLDPFAARLDGTGLGTSGWIANLDGVPAARQSTSGVAGSGDLMAAIGHGDGDLEWKEGTLASLGNGSVFVVVADTTALLPDAFDPYVLICNVVTVAPTAADVAFDNGKLWVLLRYSNQCGAPANVFVNTGVASALVGFNDPTSIAATSDGYIYGALDQMMKAEAIAPTPDGVLVTGSFTGTILVQGAAAAVTNPTGIDHLFVLHEQGTLSNQNVIWATVVETTSGVAANDIATDGAGNVFVAGTLFGGAMSHEGRNLLNAIGDDAFVLKLTPDGYPLWAARIDGPGNDGGNALVTTADGGAIVTGFVGNGVDGVEFGMNDIFIARIDD